MRYLLDTNIISDAVKNPGGSVDTALRQHRDEEIGTSLVTGEILYGLARKKDVRSRRRLDIQLGALTIWPLESLVDDAYGQLRADLEKRGNRSVRTTSGLPRNR